MRKQSELGTGILGLALVYLVLRPGGNANAIIQSMNTSFLAGTIKAATGGTVIKDMRTAAEHFKEEAMEAIGDFWKGFSE